jgi:hypothetical protein|tara:strand:- start:153 stop:323 length:171 start_codon:yes stop_codon:yes gene_type:complete
LLLLLLIVVVAKEEKDRLPRGTVGVDKTLLDFRAFFDEDVDDEEAETMPHLSMNTS